MDRDLLVRLVEAIRNDRDRQASDVLSLIRSNAPLDEIRLLLAGTQHNARAKLLRHSPNRYMDVKRIADIPLFEVPAQPWTIITDDDAFVSHLISLYFTWQNPIMNWIDRDLFLADMRSGRLDSRFCSPLLVNSILAVACVSLHTSTFFSTFLALRPLPNHYLLYHSSTPTILRPMLYQVNLSPGETTSSRRHWLCYKRRKADSPL